MPILSLCAGYEGLGMAVEEITGDAVRAYAEIHPGAIQVLEHRFPGRPNIGDITEADWGEVKRRFPDVDIVAAGFPCQDISDAGYRKGIKDGTRSGIWRNVAACVGVLRPRLVFLENVSAIRSRGLDIVSEDLAAIGYELRWTCIRASDAGAPHPRDRWFAVARPVRNAEGVVRIGAGAAGQPEEPHAHRNPGHAPEDAHGEHGEQRREPAPAQAA